MLCIFCHFLWSFCHSFESVITDSWNGILEKFLILKNNSEKSQRFNFIRSACMCKPPQYLVLIKLNQFFPFFSEVFLLTFFTDEVRTCKWKFFLNVFLTGNKFSNSTLKVYWITVYEYIYKENIYFYLLVGWLKDWGFVHSRCYIRILRLYVLDINMKYGNCWTIWLEMEVLIVNLKC